jgi:hypothetical protein
MSIMVPCRSYDLILRGPKDNELAWVAFIEIVLDMIQRCHNSGVEVEVIHPKEWRYANS